MIKNEIHALWHNKLLLIVLLAIMLIPAMYAGLFLASMWDPYGDLEYLPVAVVNRDEPVTYNDKELTVGDDLAENLKENDSMAFNIVDAETAKTGLQNGTYYMVITIPEDFSKNASTLMDEKPKKMVLQYETNPGKNYISMKLSESAMKEIKANLTEEITHTYAQTVFDSLTEIENGFQDAVEGTDEMLDGEDKLREGNDTITENLAVLADSTLTFKEGSDTLAAGLKTYTEGVSQVKDGANTLGEGVKSYTDGVATAKTGSDTLASKSGDLLSGVDTVSAGAKQLKTEGTTPMYQGLKKMQEELGKSVNPDNAKAVKEAQDKLKQLQDGIAQLHDGVGGAGASINALTASVAGVGGNVQEAAGKLYVPNATEGSLYYTQKAGESVQTALDKINEGDQPGALAALGEAAGYLSNSSTAQQAALSKLAEAGSTLTSLSQSNTAALVNQLSAGVNQLYDGSQQLPVLSQTLGTMYAGLSTVKTTLDEQLVPGAKKIDAGMDALQKGIDGSLKTGVKQYTDGVAQMNTGLTTLAENNKALTEGVAAISKGAGKLVSNNDTIMNGVYKLSDGATQISDGAGKLRDGSVSLGDGLNTLTDGTVTLHDALAEGKDEIAENEASDDTLDMFAEPVELEETKITEVENNGHAMAAYMFSVGIWVGCLAFCLMYPLAKYTGELTNGRDWWASKAVILYPLATLMIVLLMVIMHFALGFNPASMPKTLLVGFAAVSCFMSIMYFFNLLLGKVGSFLMLLFMVLQLAGSAGTYPVEISGSLAEALHKWVPFTYSVDAFRATIAANAAMPVKEIVILFAIGIVFTLLTIGVFRVRTVLAKQNKPFLYEWLEEKGLA